MAPWTEGHCLNSTYGDVSPADIRAAYDEQDHHRLAKSHYDPGNLFRLGYNIPPAGNELATT